MIATSPPVFFLPVAARDHTAGGKAEGFSLVLQATRNQTMHSKYGNTTIRLYPAATGIQARIVLCLDDLIPDHTYSKSVLLQHKPSVSVDSFSSPPLTTVSLPALESQTTPPSFTSDWGSSLKVGSTHKHRTGMRRRRIDSNGQVFFCKIRSQSKTRRPHRIKELSRIQNPTQSQVPPPRGTPGASFEANEEYPHQGQTAKEQSRGAIRRRWRRRQYRLWRRITRNQWVGGAGSPPPAVTPPKKASHNRAKWFRQSLLWQKAYPRQRKPKIKHRRTTPPLQYHSKFRVGSLNVQGFADTLKLKNALLLMEEHRLDVLMLSETRSTSYYSYLSEQHLVILSGNNKDKFGGVGAIISPRARPHLLDVIQLNNRILHLAFGKKGGDFHVIGAYGPQSGLDLEDVRRPFWDTLEAHLNKIPQPEPIILTGDFNVRFQAPHRNDQGVTGPYTYGKGSRYIDHNASSNRSLCVQSMSRQNMVETASHREPLPVHHITYRDKAAPPNSWSQFVQDPLVLQQVYSSLQPIFQENSLELAAQIRSFLDLPDPLPPERTDPHPDPTRFQRLDHTFVRSQWLKSINSCRSKLHTGYPTDHYLLVTESQCKLCNRPKTAKPHSKLNFKTLTPEIKQHYNELITAALDTEQPEAPQTTPPLKKGVFYTDGSGSRGRCSAKTPAGWGWCSPQGETWEEAKGPVITSPDHTAFLGANVGSNNTGELSAIAEAVLYALEHNYTSINIHTDSQWSIKVLTGKWRPKTHHNLINYIRGLLRQPTLKVHLHWVRAHRGTEGNEKADQLANQGRALAAAQGGREYTAPQLPIHNETLSTFQQLENAMHNAAAQTFKVHPYNKRTSWIREETLTALAAARNAEAEQDHNAKALRNKAKRMARKDRIHWVHQQLQQDPSGDHSAIWKTMKNQKRGFVGKKSHLVVDGKPVPWSKTHEAFRDHLQNKQWAAPTLPPHAIATLEGRPQLHDTTPDSDPFTLEELQKALSKLKSNKAPGPDGTLNEYFQLIDHQVETKLLTLYNETLQSRRRE